MSPVIFDVVGDAGRCPTATAASTRRSDPTTASRRFDVRFLAFGILSSGHLVDPPQADQPRAAIQNVGVMMFGLDRLALRQVGPDLGEVLVVVVELLGVEELQAGLAFSKLDRRLVVDVEPSSWRGTRRCRRPCPCPSTWPSTLVEPPDDRTRRARAPCRHRTRRGSPDRRPARRALPRAREEPATRQPHGSPRSPLAASPRRSSTILSGPAFVCRPIGSSGPASTRRRRSLVTPAWSGRCCSLHQVARVVGPRQRRHGLPGRIPSGSSSVPTCATSRRRARCGPGTAGPGPGTPCR